MTEPKRIGREADMLAAIKEHGGWLPRDKRERELCERLAAKGAVVPISNTHGDVYMEPE